MRLKLDAVTQNLVGIALQQYKEGLKAGLEPRIFRSSELEAQAVDRLLSQLQIDPEIDEDVQG